ncbi:hypothetical protein Tco_0196407 [Tanacetum coccineum]
MQAGMIGTLQALWEVFPLFSNTKWGENSNLAFLTKHMRANFEERTEPLGGFETLKKWVSGAYAGHSYVCLRDPQGKLWVGESGHEDEEVMVLNIDNTVVSVYQRYMLLLPCPKIMFCLPMQIINIRNLEDRDIEPQDGAQ